MVLIDTSVWILALKKGAVKEGVRERVEVLLREDQAATFGMIKLELLGGVKDRGEFSRLKGYLDSIFEIAADYGLWEQASEVAFLLRRKGITVPSTDILIASAALYSGMSLFHVDMHFGLIAKHTDLKVESPPG